MKRRLSVRSKKFHIEHWYIMSILLAVYDIMAVNVSYFLALLFRFDGFFSQIPDYYVRAYVKFIPIYTILCLVIFYASKMYQSVWQYASFNELAHTCIGSTVASLLHILLITVIYYRMPISYYLWGSCFQMILLVAARFSYRFLLLEIRRVRSSDGSHNVMVIGAGGAGQTIIRSIVRNRLSGDKVVCIIDDNPNKWNRYIDGIPIVGGRDDIMYFVEKYDIDKIYIAIPSASKENKRDIINICSETNCVLKNLPDFYQYANTDINIGSLRDVSVEDLLGREPLRTDMSDVFEMIKGKTILVTGGGGSIGSELCRQIAAHQPERLIIFDIYENNAYAIQQELREKYPEMELTVLIGSVRDSRRLEYVFKKYHPDIVYHAAAHKHVPLMEDSPCEAIKNNVVGTYKTAYAAMINNCKRFVLISTDKAVNPTNIMGASKRLCEMVIQAFDRCVKNGDMSSISTLHIHPRAAAAEPEGKLRTEFVAVRFGNVLGSNGSVVPLFKQQIERGGPLTVTHPDIVRYFMTIPEAVSLVLLAGAYAHGGEIFVLDMGSPVKIDTLARNLIKLSGLVPDVDIKIEYTGLRPGEKLYEEKLMAEEGLKRTPNKLIHIGNPIPFDTAEFRAQLEELMTAAYDNDDDIRTIVEKMVPTYIPKKD
ncbi:MAG: nucleoside-diphosphate sugar epimerase/dehydratase [Oscillospiraceae bacterium]|nr:nucleoside-diphosphate sugar epimerase/dehydratase [Oscillospiraceae bacterium]